MGSFSPMVESQQVGEDPPPFNLPVLLAMNKTNFSQSANLTVLSGDTSGFKYIQQLLQNKQAFQCKRPKKKIGKSTRLCQDARGT